MHLRKLVAAMIAACFFAVMPALPADATPRDDASAIWISDPSAAAAKRAQEQGANAIVWASCGIFDSDSKLVRLYYMSRRSDIALRCGNDSVGYRHILKNHRTQFEALAAGTYQNWRALADDAISASLSDPDHQEPRPGGKTCRDHLMYLVNIRTGEVIGSHMFLVITGDASKNVITSYPSSC